MSESSKSESVGQSLLFSLAGVGLGFIMIEAGKYFYSDGLCIFGGLSIIMSGIMFFVNLANRAAEKHAEGTDTGLWRPIYYIAMAVFVLFMLNLVCGWNIIRFL